MSTNETTAWLAPASYSPGRALVNPGAPTLARTTVDSHGHWLTVAELARMMAPIDADPAAFGCQPAGYVGRRRREG